MAHVVTSPCVGTHDTACMKPCPVNCFYDVELEELRKIALSMAAAETPNVEQDLELAKEFGLTPTAARRDLTKMLIINPDECIDCGLCVPECPVSAIFPLEDVPENEKKYVDINKNWFVGKDAAALDAHRITP